ncbi:uncharacterized protein LOC127731653 isoform X2 [Mytilus californianus]|uniref:uncharacterized protein LOC127731653 isoform X2 n=1 Tax=Mytilus californianus TaxID=6549 RepID=UPI0022452CE9|nr:uncharacterized protein LOC127731653 isoform X2 [Mytilus californianus]
MLDKIKILIGLKFSWFVIVIIIVPTIGFNQHYKSSAKPIKISTKDGVLFCGSSRIHGNASLHGRCSPCGAINSDETSLLSKSKYDVNGEIAHINFSIHSSINGQLYFRFCEISNLKHCLKNDKVYIKESSERMYNFSAGNQTVSLHLHIPKQFNNGQYLLQSNVILNLVHLVNCVPVITNNNADKHSLQINEERRTIDMEPDGLIDGYEGLHDHNLPENHWTDQQNNSNGINYKQKKTLLEIPDNELAALDNYNNTVQNNVDTKNAEELSQHHEASSSQFYRNTRENVFTSVIGAIFDYFKGKSGNSSRDTKLVTQEDYVWKDGKDNKTINLITIDGLNSSVINKQIDKNSYIVGHGAGRESYETPEPLLVHNISFNTDSIANEINVERNGSYVHVSGFIENVTDVLDEKNQDYRHGTKNEIISNAINLYGIAIPPTDTNINSLHDKEDTNNGKIEEVGNYINAQFTQIEELSNKKSVVRTGKHQVAIGRKDLMEIYQHTNHHNVIHQQKTDSSTKRNNEITSINHNNDSVKEGPAFSWLSGKSAEVRNSGTMFVPTFEAIDPIEHSGIHRPALAFAKNTNSVSRKRIKKKKRKKSKRKSKTRLRKTKTDHTKKETLSQPVTKSIQKSKTTSIKPISQSKVKSIQSAVEPRKDVSKVSNSFNQLEQLVNLVMSTKGKQKHQNVQLKKKQRQDVPKVSNKYNKLKQLVSLVKSVKEPKAFGETHKSAKFRTDVKHVFGTLGKKKLQQGAERKMKPLANFIPKSYGINIKSANKELKVNEQKYQVHKQAKPSIKRILNAKRYQIKSSNHKGKQNLNYIVTSKGDSVSKTNNTTLQLDPDYIVTGSMDLNGTNNHLFTNEKGQTSTHKFASHIINDLVQRGFLEENHASGMSTAPGSPLKISKPNAKFIDEQFRKPNNKHSIKILPSSQTPERDYFKISPRSTNSDYSEVIHSTVEPVPSPKPSVITELMKMGFIDKYTLPIIDIRKSNDTHIKPETGSRSKSNSSQYTVLETKEKANNFNEQTVNGYIASKKIVGKKGKNKPKEKNMNEQNPNAQNLLSKDLKILDLLKMGFIDKETLSLIDLIKSNVTRVTQDIDKADLEVTKSLRENFQSSAKVLINSKATEQNHISTSSNIDSTKESNKKEGMQTNKQIVPSDFKLSNILKGDAKTITDNQKHRENNEKTISKDNKILELMKMGFIDEATLPIIDLTKSDVIKVTSKTGDLELKSTKENKQINRLNSERVNIVNRDEQLMSKDKTTGKIYSQSELIDLVLKDGTEKLKDIEVREHDKQTQDTSNIEGEAPLKTDKVNKKYNSLKSKKLPKRKTKLKFNETIDSTQNAHLQFNKSVDVNDKKKGKIQDTIINKENIIIKDVESDNANTQLQLNMSQAERQINQSRKSLNIKKIDHQQFIASIIKKQKKKWKKKSRRRMKNKTKSRIQTSKENLSKFVIGAQTNESVLEFEKSARMNVIAKSEIGTLDNEDVKDQLKFNNSFTGSPMNLKDSLQNAPKKAKKSRSRKKKKTPNEDKTENKEMFFETDLTSPVSQSAGNKNIKIRKMSTSKLPSKEDFLDTQKLNPHAIKGIPKSLLKHDVDMIIQKTVLSGRKTKTSKKVTGKSTRPKTKTKKTKAVTSSKHKSKDDRKLLPVNLNTLDYTSQTNINNSEPSKLDLHSESEIIKSNEHLKTVNIPMSTTSKVNSTSQRSENTDKNEVKYEEGEQSLKLSNQNEESTNDTTKITKHERKEISEIGEEDSTIKSKKTISKDISPTNKSSLSSRDSTLHATNIPNKKQQTVISELIVPNQMLSDKSSDKLPPIKSGSLINIKQREHQTLSRLNTSQHVYTNKTTTSISPQQTRNETLLNENEMQSIKIQNLMNQTLDGVETKQVSSSEILDTSVIDKSPLENTLDVQGNQESVDSNITMWSTETKDNSTSLADNDEKNTAEVFQDNLPTVERNIIKTHEDLKDRLTPRDRNVSRSSTEKQTRQNLSDRNESKTTKGNKGKITMVETVTSKEHSDRVLLGDRNVTKTTKDENENDFINQKKENDFIKQKKENDFIKQKKENDFIKQLRDLKERMMSEAANDKSSTVNSEDRLSSVDIMVKGRNMKKEENASLRTSVAPKYELHLNGEGALQYNHSPLVSKPDLVDMYKEMNYSDPKLKVPDTSSYNNRRNKKYPQIHSVPSGRGKVNSVSYSAILRSFRKEGGNQPMLNRPNIVGEQFLGASSQFDYPTSTSQQNLVLAEQQGTTTTVPTSVDSSGLVSARVDQTENTKWASLASGIMQRDKKAPGVVIDNKRTSIVGGKQWPALVAQHLQWTDTAPNSMSLSMGHNTDGRYISDPFTGKDRHIGTIDKVNSGMHLNGKGVSNLRPKQRKTVDNDQQFENILNSLVDVAMESSYLAQEQRGGIVDQTMGRVVDKAIKTQTRKGNPATPMYSKWDRHGTMHNNDRDMINNYRISSVPLPQNIDRNPNTDVNRIKDQNSVDLSLGYQQTTSTQPPNLFMYGKSQNYWWHDRQVRGPSDVLTFSGANLPLNSMRRRIGNKPVNSVKSTILNSKVSKADINRSSPRVRNDRILKVATEPDIVLLNRKPDIGLHSSEPGIELHSRRAIDLHNKEEIQTTDVNLNNKPSQIYSNIELPGLKAPGLQIRSMETPKKKNIQFGGLFVAQNAANEQQERIKMQDEPNRAIRPHQRLTNKKTIHLMPGILGAHDILSLQNQHNSQPDVTDLHTPTVPYSRLVPQNQYHNTIPGTPNYGFPFEMSLLQFQHARNQGTRRIRVRSPQEMAKTQIHYDAGLANKVSSNNLNPNDYAYEYPGQPHEVVVNINIMKNLSNVCAPDERFTCNPVENNVAVSELRSLCISSCNQGYCPVDKCSCFCVSLTTLDVKNIIVESNKVVPSKQTNLLGHILENSGTNTPKLPKTVNIIGMNSDISGTTSPKNSNTMNIIGMKAGNLGTGSPKPSKTVNIIGMNAENSINGFPAPFKTENNIGMNAENLGTGSPSPPKTVNIIGMNAETSGTAPPTPSNTLNMIGMVRSNPLPHEVLQIPRVTCTVTSLFLSIKGMIDWCNTECNISLNNCPMHICDCQFIL